MDKKDAAICAAVWRAWATYTSISHQEICEAAGISSVSLIEFHVKGRQGQSQRRVGGGLIEHGWLTGAVSRGQGSGLARTLRPGRRFAGLDSGAWPLEVV